MKLSNIDFPRFCIRWSILGAVILSVTLLIMGTKSWGIFFTVFFLPSFYTIASPCHAFHIPH